jgi:hypothetical protein
MDPDLGTYLALNPLQILTTSFKTCVNDEKFNVSDKKIKNINLGRDNWELPLSSTEARREQLQMKSVEYGSARKAQN